MFTLGILWGAGFLIMGICNRIWPAYGTVFLDLLASVYPGYNATGSVGDLMIGLCYALVDAVLGALIFGWVYNWFVGRLRQG